MSGLFSLGVAVAWFGLVIVIVRPAFARLAAASDQAVLVAGTSLAILSAGVSEALASMAAWSLGMPIDRPPVGLNAPVITSNRASDVMS